MRTTCLLVDAAVAAPPEARALLGDPRFDVVEAPSSDDPSLAEVLGWARAIAGRLADDEVGGAVAVLPVAVLAEAAYLLDLAVGGSKPLVVTGAMRRPDHRAPDGPRNLVASLHLARHPALVGACALVVAAGTVHAARDVTRTCATSVEAFASPLLGPLGFVGPAGPVALTRRPPPREHLPATRVEDRVVQLAAGLGDGGELVGAALAAGARGIVVETRADGSVPAGLAAELAAAAGNGTPVVAAARARGEPSVTGTSVGGHAWLRDHGVLRADGLAPDKARVRLALALGLDARGAVRAAFPPAAETARARADRRAAAAPRPPATR